MLFDFIHSKIILLRTQEHQYTLGPCLAYLSFFLSKKKYIIIPTINMVTATILKYISDFENIAINKHNVEYSINQFFFIILN